MLGKLLNTGFEEELKRLKRECEQAEEWIVIGHTLLVGDPIIVDLGEAGHPVSYLMHGMGEWDAGSYIAGSMQHLREDVEKVNQWMTGQSRPQANRNLPVTCAELDALAAEIAEMDYADAETWKMLLNPAYESAKAYEEEMIRQIRAMNGQGTPLKEMADRLGIPMKQVYGFLKMIKASSNELRGLQDGGIYTGSS
ncbi:hypothetical protein EHV15_13885 [Paenibacillus oralis]|uniref:Uncharacterized protein n=1 Tax=Paenibacillus oralis TaxID=2490856 RepID=A0A3P3U1C3_9BACL|nr:hypothetical protein [Paenibacillus oralis]RRJ63900.1 hypothetical protein EHV15_13885 [Paenibacillus oralis]